MDNTYTANVDGEWTQITVSVDTKDLEAAENIAVMTVPYGIYTEDYSDLENEVMQIAHIDLISEDLLKSDRTKGKIHIYINPHENPAEAVSFLEERLNAQNIEYSITLSGCEAEDWINNWKHYFHPMPIGNKLLIKPDWEEECDPEGRYVLNIEPGLAFGTGSHPTTKLCLEMLEKYISSSSMVLDVGCGSGILSVACLLLGAENALGIDIDPLAVKTAVQNAEKNGFDSNRFTAKTGNLAQNVDGKYSVIVANIVADIVIELNKSVPALLADGGIYITGGIIENREDEVLRSFAENGFEV